MMCSYVLPFVFWWVVTYLDITIFLYRLKYSGRRTTNDQQPYLNGMIPQQRMVECGLQGAYHTIYEIPISTLRIQITMSYAEISAGLLMFPKLKGTRKS